MKTVTTPREFVLVSQIFNKYFKGMNTFRRVSEATPAGDINESPVPPAANILSTKLLAKKIFRLYSDI